MEPHQDALDTTIQASIEAPDETKVLVASMDGANVLLREPGVRRGRPSERPRPEEAEEPKNATYKNAMVGAIFLLWGRPQRAIRQLREIGGLLSCRRAPVQGGGGPVRQEQHRGQALVHEVSSHPPRTRRRCQSPAAFHRLLQGAPAGSAQAAARPWRWNGRSSDATDIGCALVTARRTANPQLSLLCQIRTLEGILGYLQTASLVCVNRYVK